MKRTNETKTEINEWLRSVPKIYQTPNNCIENRPHRTAADKTVIIVFFYRPTEINLASQHCHKRYLHISRNSSARKKRYFGTIDILRLILNKTFSDHNILKRCNYV